MRIIRGVAIGLLAGAAFFFFPFLLGILFFFLLLSAIIRLSVGRRWGGRYGGPQYMNRHRFGQGYDGGIISLSGRGFVPPAQGNGNKSSIPVS